MLKRKYISVNKKQTELFQKAVLKKQKNSSCVAFNKRCIDFVEYWIMLDCFQIQIMVPNPYYLITNRNLRGSLSCLIRDGIFNSGPFHLYDKASTNSKIHKNYYILLITKHIISNKIMNYKEYNRHT